MKVKQIKNQFLKEGKSKGYRWIYPYPMCNLKKDSPHGLFQYTAGAFYWLPKKIEKVC